MREIQRATAIECARKKNMLSKYADLPNCCSVNRSIDAASYAIRFAHFKSHFMQFRFLFFLFVQKLTVKMNTHALDRETLIQIVRQFKGFAKIV